MNSEKRENYIILIFVITSIIVEHIWGFTAARITLEVEFLVWCICVAVDSFKCAYKRRAVLFLVLAVIDLILLLVGFWL